VWSARGYRESESKRERGEEVAYADEETFKVNFTLK
jgi:hypothetical protein